jgi:predicted AAA+ superfamily ATPase
MFTRQLPLPDRTFFLFGPRGTGKTTWLSSVLPGVPRFDLLVTRDLMSLMRDPSRFSQQVEALPARGWVVVDEIQRMPSLLDEIHALMNRHADDYRFALTGSSARKLKRGGANLLAGRAINRRFFPLTGAEMRLDFELDDLLRFGCLPAVRSEATESGRVDILDAYVANYVREEIQLEAAVRNLESFTRFLEVAGIMNAEVIQVAGMARDAAVARQTVQGYLQVLEDTLIGFRLPAWRARAKVKEVRHPKFYLFDPGVVRGVAGRLREPLSREERGKLLETLVLHELRAWINAANLGGRLSYWRTPSGSEIDFVWSRGERTIGIEVKAGVRWRSVYARSLRELHGAGKLDSCFAVYGGDTRLQDGPVRVLPVREFMGELAEGNVIG